MSIRMGLVELIFRILCDIKPDAVADGAFLFGQTEDNQRSVLSAAQHIILNNLAKRILIIETGGKSGYPGFKAWEKKLLKSGIQKSKIVGVDLKKTISLNTLIEAEALINFAKRECYRSIYVVASPFHQLRAFMTSVTVALKAYPDILIYSYTGNSLPWLGNAAHSQGTTVGIRKSLIKSEFERIHEYQRKGDLESENKIVDYLNRRDMGF